jgi:hypothetical protein
MPGPGVLRREDAASRNVHAYRHLPVPHVSVGEQDRSRPQIELGYELQDKASSL